MNYFLFGKIDIIILLILIAINTIVFLKFQGTKLNCIVTIGIVILYGLILPIISQGFEVSRVVAINGIDDSFTLLYTFLRFPIYWFLGVIQLVLIAISFKSNKAGESKDS